MNPGLQDPLRFHRRTPPCAAVIFGANGDLTRRKLMPALYRLAFEGRLGPGFAVIGMSRTPMSDDEFRELMRQSVSKYLEDSPFDEELWRSFAQGLFYLSGDVMKPEAYESLRAKLTEVEQSRSTGGNVLFYLSTQPSQYAPIAEGLGAAGVARGTGWRRIVIEKPFGHDLESARHLNERLQAVFDESSIYRIDHYLGKETVQNILAFRFGNGIFEPLWNRRYIEHIQITAAESIGVEGRGAYYQEAGALRDMVTRRATLSAWEVSCAGELRYDNSTPIDLHFSHHWRILHFRRPRTGDRDTCPAFNASPCSLGETQESLSARL